MEAQKATSFDKLQPFLQSSFKNKVWACSTKFDGNMIFIKKEGENVRFFTSSLKEFNLPNISNLLGSLEGDFTFAAEFMWGCEGKLGDRVHSAILTTLRTRFSKGEGVSDIDFNKCNIKVFDVINSEEKFEERLAKCKSLLDPLTSPLISVVDVEILSGDKALEKARLAVKEGWEGLMAIDPYSYYSLGKRVKHAVKLKFRRTADLLCVGVEQGLGKCNGIGALILRDKSGREVRVGSGLDYSEAVRKGEGFVGKVIEIEYEQILDTYIQPVFVCVRHDKSEEDIDG